MMIRKVLSLCLSAALIFTGCSFSKKSPDEVKAEAFDEVSQKMRESTLDTRNAAMNAGDFKVSFEPGVEPNQYSLTVTATRNVPKITLNIKGLSPITLENQKRISSSIVPLRLRDKDYVEVSVSTFTADNVLASVVDLGEYSIPRDFVYQGRESLTQDAVVEYKDEDKVVKKYNRIIFKRDATLNLNGHNLKLETNELIFEGNNVISAHHKYNREEEVKSAIIDGADLTITAKKSVGDVQIRMIGQPGKSGESTLNQAYKLLNLNIAVPARSGRNGNPADYKEFNVKANRPDQSLETKVVCKTQPTDGENGADGIILHGTDGTPGGDTGNLVIDIEDYSQSRFSIFFIPGKGGRGGEANFQGQKGGKGGLAGKSALPCGKVQNGKDGRDSTLADSRPGTDGQDGRVGKLIVPHIPQHFQIVTELTPENR